MKKYIFGAAVAIVLSACSDDYLNIKDPNNMSDLTFWQTEENMEKALQACYGTLLFQGIYQQWYDLVFEMRGDLCYNESAWRDYANFSKFQAPSSNWECIQYCWNHYYQGINATNQYLAHIDDESIEMDPETADTGKGSFLATRTLLFQHVSSLRRKNSHSDRTVCRSHLPRRRHRTGSMGPD